MNSSNVTSLLPLSSGVTNLMPVTGKHFDVFCEKQKRLKEGVT
jgi:hypothetical protein